MAIDEINAKGGVLGKKLEPVVVDPASNWPLFAEKTKQLLTQDKVAVIFGCWTSVSRKSVLPVVEELNGLLFYPVQYEGEELSKNVFYTGAAPNQQAIPAVEYLMSKEGGGAKRFVLLGTDYVYPRTTNKILRAFLKSKGVADADIMEEYTPFGHSDYQTIIAKIKKFSSEGKKTAVISTINGDSNVPFYKELGNAGLKAKDVPVVAFSVGEEELRGVDTKPLVGHLAAWNYFMSVKNPTNTEFTKKWAPTPRPRTSRPQGQAADQRPDGSHLHRRPHVGAGGREGQVDRHRQGDRRHGRPDLQGAVGLHRHDGHEEPPPAQAGVHRRDQGRRPVQRGVEDAGPGQGQALVARTSKATTRRRTSRTASRRSELSSMSLRADPQSMTPWIPARRDDMCTVGSVLPTLQGPSCFKTILFLLACSLAGAAHALTADEAKAIAIGESDTRIEALNKAVSTPTTRPPPSSRPVRRRGQDRRRQGLRGARRQGDRPRHGRRGASCRPTPKTCQQQPHARRDRLRAVGAEAVQQGREAARRPPSPNCRRIPTNPSCP
jgi:urea transport system substrate-binding protein